VSVGRCIPELLAQGKLTNDQADRARELFDGHSAELSKSMSPFAAEAVASKRTLDALDFEALERRRRTLLQVKAADFADAWLTRGGEHWGGGNRKGGRGAGGGGIIPGEGPVGPVNPKAARTLMGLIDARRQAIEGEAFGHIAGILRRHRAIVPGVLRHAAEMDELGMEAFGEASGSLAAKEAVGAVRDTQEWVRLRANAAGANIGKLENRGFATHHDTRKVAEAGFEAWWAAERPRWDLARMVDEETGQPFTEKRLLEAARAVHATIASDGALDRAPGSAGRLSFANRLGQHRFIHYKSYADWKASQAQFGTGTAFDALVGEIKGMSRAIAAMELLGPNPEATVRHVQDRVAGDPELFKPGQLRKRDRSAKKARSSLGYGMNIPAPCGSRRAAGSRWPSRPIAAWQARPSSAARRSRRSATWATEWRRGRSTACPSPASCATISSCSIRRTRRTAWRRRICRSFPKCGPVRCRAEPVPGRRADRRVRPASVGRRAARRRPLGDH
jgi:hypothetical protein